MKKFLAILAGVALAAGAVRADSTNTITNAYGMVITYVTDAYGVHVTSVVPASTGSSAGVMPAPNPSDSIQLASGKILIGDANGKSAAQTVSGDFTISSAGVGAIAAGVIVNADIKTNAAIAASKLADADLGDVSIASGVVSIDAGAIVNADINNSAAIALTKLANSITFMTLTNVVDGTTNTYSVLTGTP